MVRQLGGIKYKDRLPIYQISTLNINEIMKTNDSLAIGMFVYTQILSYCISTVLVLAPLVWLFWHWELQINVTAEFTAEARLFFSVSVPYNTFAYYGFN